MVTVKDLGTKIIPFLVLCDRRVKSVGSQCYIFCGLSQRREKKKISVQASVGASDHFYFIAIQWSRPFLLKAGDLDK